MKGAIDLARQYILALDQGTTSSRAILFDKDAGIRGVANKELAQHFPQPGWVEHDPMDIWNSQLEVAQQVLKESGVSADEVAAIGVTNQRETTIIWNKKTGKPVYNAIVWQCRRTAPICEEMRSAGWAGKIQDKTGLVLDAYFSGTKVKWILDNVPGARQQAEAGALLFGNVDTWLIWNLTGGQVHVTDYSNASRTLLYNIYDLKWDEEILAYLKIPKSLLPKVLPSSQVYGETVSNLLGASIPVAGDAGDQQAALFGQTCFTPGTAKNTYGTGSFMLLNTGEKAVASKKGLVTTIAWGVNGKVFYALEGSVFIAGAAIQWLRDQLRILDNSAQSEEIALSVEDSGGVYVVPAFVGLGAPYWDMYARGTIVGITRGTTREQLVRATLESIAYQSRDVLDVMAEEAHIGLQALRVDGGAAMNNFLMQFQADVVQATVDRPRVAETTALGAAFLAGLAVGFWGGLDELSTKWKIDKSYKPAKDAASMNKLYAGWQRAVQRAMKWEES
jgi:glycerol kinase